MLKFPKCFRPFLLKSFVASFLIRHINQFDKKSKLYYNQHPTETDHLITQQPTNLNNYNENYQKSFNLMENLENIEYKTTYDIEKEITELVVEAELLINQDKIKDAKKLLKKASKIAMTHQVYSNISSVYDLLILITYRDGKINETEEMLVKFIDNLLQLGYPDNHNSIIRFQLKLSRLYQTNGNSDMAELGFKHCIREQEAKLYHRNYVYDDITNTLYTNSLFWYGKLLLDKEDFLKSQYYFQKCLQQTLLSKTITPNQKMVVHYYNAEISTILGELDNALQYLYKAIDIGTLEHFIPNPDLPMYVIKIGMIYMRKGLYTNAHYWCTNGQTLAEGNEAATKEAKLCLDQLDKVFPMKEHSKAITSATTKA